GWMRVVTGYAAVACVLFLSINMTTGGTKREVVGGDPGVPGKITVGDLSRSSLPLIPENAAFYMVALNNKAELDPVLNSKTYARLKEMPAWKKFIESSDVKSPDLDEFLKDPDNKDLFPLLNDMWQQEVFVYGGESCSNLVELLGEFASASLSSSPLSRRPPS